MAPADSSSYCLSAEDRLGPHERLVQAFLGQRRGSRTSGQHLSYAAAARHFMFWLDKRRIPLISVDETVVRRFAKHRCDCRYYPSRAFLDRDYVGRIRCFVRFLEDRGTIPLSDDIGPIAALLVAFEEELVKLGYRDGPHKRFLVDAEHFAYWLRLSRIPWAEVDDAVVKRFSRHECHCSLFQRHRLNHPSRPANRRRAACHFIRFLRKQGVIPVPSSGAELTEEPRLTAYRHWLRNHRGATEASVVGFVDQVSRWLSTLGSDPAFYNAWTIRNAVLKRSGSSHKFPVTALRSYLRFLVSRGECRPELVHAVPSLPRRRLATLPRYTSPATIERIIASCESTRPAHIRDRAIILLLARLGLRAGDVCQLRLADIDWTSGHLRVHGKGRRTVRLPLPQDAGDALLAYIEGVRPRVKEEKIFLRAHAPFTPFRSSSEISGIYARLRGRAGIDGVPTGAHMFRHSLATGMLRGGGTLESVGAILRHQSPTTTAIYAKVDTTMLLEVAQSWPGDVSC